MNIQLPTDNLYKFMAIFGLVLTITSLWGLLYLNNTITNTVTNVRDEKSKVENIIKQIPIISQDLNEAIKSELLITNTENKSIGKIKNSSLSAEQVAVLKDNMSENDIKYLIAKQNYALAFNKFMDIGNYMRVLEKQNNLFQQIMNSTSTYLVYFDISLIIGVALMLFGFKLWYTKVQMFQDRILEAEANYKYPQMNDPNMNKEQSANELT